MPIYEYRCRACRRRTSVFVRSFAAPDSAACEHCGCPDTARVFSRVAVLRSDEGGPFADEAAAYGVDENDPRSVAKWLRKMSREMDEPLDHRLEEDLERMEAGDFPDDGGEDDEFGDGGLGDFD